MTRSAQKTSFRIKLIPVMLASVLHLNLSAQTIYSNDGKSLKLPSQFIVFSEGIKWIQPGKTNTVVAKWSNIDMKRLASTEPDIDGARQKAILTQENLYFKVQPVIATNYYRTFLGLEVNIKFQEEWKAITQGTVCYSMSTSGFVDTRTGFYSGTASGTGQIHAQTDILDVTRPSLNTTIEGLLMEISNVSNRNSANLIRDLKESGPVFTNLILIFDNLKTAYPQDKEIYRTITALHRLKNSRAVNTDSMRQIRLFVLHAKKLAQSD